MSEPLHLRNPVDNGDHVRPSGPTGSSWPCGSGM
jgi:hypothetical protein